MTTIHIDDATRRRLRVFVASENIGKVYGGIGKTAAIAINRYIDQEEEYINELARKALNPTNHDQNKG